jgi:hypothetical protein
MKFTIYADPGHSWAKVPRKLIHSLGIAHRITPYSYQRGEYVYLEEDLDLNTFVEAYRAQISPALQFVEKYTDRSSKIRTYFSYRIT